MENNATSLSTSMLNQNGQSSENELNSESAANCPKRGRKFSNHNSELRKKVSIQKKKSTRGIIGYWGKMDFIK